MSLEDILLQVETASLINRIDAIADALREEADLIESAIEDYSKVED